MATISNILEEKGGLNEDAIFECNICDFKCSKKYNFDRHLNTRRHCQATFGNNLATKKEEKEEKEEKYCCEYCGKIYKHRTGIWRHKNKCKEIKEIKETKEDKEQDQIKEEFHLDKEFILMLINQNKELLEIVKNGTHNTTHTNSHNKAFNLNFFLNETCKNAMNINDFVDSIKLQLSDLMNVGELGFVEGISNIIVKNLNNLDETERPVHCTDKKRETIYIKDEGKWEKADDNKTQLRNMIKRIANKNINLLPKFREKYPEYKNSYSKVSDVYDKMVIEVMETDPVKSEKIIRNISKVITISQNK
jgi:hypothetical protein